MIQEHHGILSLATTLAVGIAVLAASLFLLIKLGMG